MFETIKYNVENKIAIIEIDRPPVNALNSQFFVELSEVLDKIEDDDNTRVVVITGSGEKAFVAGADINEMKELDGKSLNQMSRRSRLAFEKIERLSKPVIAAINGLALGGGTELALVCDLRISSDKAKFALPEIKLGIIPGGGGTQRLQRLIGQARAKKMMFFGDMIDAELAAEYGLVDEVVPHKELSNHAKDWAEKIASYSPVTLRLLKSAINTGANVDLESALDIEAYCSNLAFQSEDRKEGMAAFAEKRKPNFVGK